MRTIVTIVAALLTSLAAAAPLPAQPKAELTPKAAGMTSQTTEINGKTLAQWIKEVRNPDAGLAEVAIRTIMYFGPDASREATPALIDALNYTDTSLRVNACITLTMIGVHDTEMKRAVSTLARRLNDDQQSIVRFYAAAALGRLDNDDARPAIPALKYRCQDQASWEIRRASAFALGKAAQATKEHPLDMSAAQALIGLFSGTSADRCAEVRLTAVQALGSMGIPPTPAQKAIIVQGLTHALKDRYKAVQIWAHMGLAADGESHEEHLAAISKYLSRDRNDFETRLQATRALGISGKDAKPYLKDLVKQLDDKEPLLVAASAWALGQMGTAAGDAAPKLEELLLKKDLDEGVKNSIKSALDKISDKPKAKQ
jgi:HEAT repeat protein